MNKEARELTNYTESANQMTSNYLPPVTDNFISHASAALPMFSPLPRQLVRLRYGIMTLRLSEIRSLFRLCFRRSSHRCNKRYSYNVY